jgi:hypothetical protein
VAKKSKIETGNADGNTGAAPKPKRKKAAPKKQAVRTLKPAAPGKAPSPKKTHPEPSDEEIRIRAYFIAERRLQLKLQGDSAHDWIEAKRQLIEEAGSASS